jgi:hypothetical protein
LASTYNLESADVGHSADRGFVSLGRYIEESSTRSQRMGALAAVVRVGKTRPIGRGMEPLVEAHLYGGGLARFVAFQVADDLSLDRVAGAYAPDLDSDTPHPITDILLALPETRAQSSISQRLDTLSTKAEANYGRTFEEMVFSSDVEWGSDGYGRLFEARSQLEAHPYEGAITLTLTPAATPAQERALRANLDRLPATTRVYTADE